MIRLLFVVTSERNLGDFALCWDWTETLGRKDHHFAYVVSPRIREQLDPRDKAYVFESDVDVAITIREAAIEFNADAVLFATNSFWNIEGQCGAEFGRFPESLADLNIPLMSFDIFGRPLDCQVALGGQTVHFPAVLDNVWSLRFWPGASESPNARYFKMETTLARAAAPFDAGVLNQYGIDPDLPAVLFPISHDRYRAVASTYCDYYAHIAKLMQSLAGAPLQLVVIAPEEVPEFRHLPNVVQLRPLPTEHFIPLVRNAKIFLTDSLISTVLYAVLTDVPVVLLANSFASRQDLSPEQKRFTEPKSSTLLAARLRAIVSLPMQILTKGRVSLSRCRSYFIDDFFQYRVFPYGFYDVGDELARQYKADKCITKVEIADQESFGNAMETLMEDGPERARIIEHCTQWKSAMAELQGPQSLLEEILAKGTPPSQ